MTNHLQEIVSQSINSLKSTYSSYKLLLIHPSSRHHTLLIAAILNNPFSPILYYSFSGDDSTFSAFLSNLFRSISEQDPQVGIGLHFPDNPAQLKAAAGAVAAELVKLSDRDFVFILDEYDRIDGNEEIQQFFEELIQVLPGNCHLLINSRTLPRLPWVSLVARNQAIVLKDSRILAAEFYTDNSISGPDLEVYCLGFGHIILNGKTIDTWDGNLPRLLFFFTLDKSLSTRNEICEALWPDLPLSQAVNVFHVTKRRLHKTFGRDVLLFENSLYRIDPSLNVHYDVLDFVSALASARDTRDLDEKANYLMNAIEVYKGHFLQGFEDSWLVRRREDFKGGYIEALASLAGIREERAMNESALSLYLRAVAETPNREDLHREVIRLYGKLERRIEAAEYYTGMKSILHDRYRLQPSVETQKVYRDAIGS